MLDTSGPAGSRDQARTERVDRQPATGLLGREYDAELQLILQLAVAATAMRCALLGLLEGSHVRLRANLGLNLPSGLILDSPVARHCLAGASMVVAEPRQDSRFRDCNLIRSLPESAFIAGVPVSVKGNQLVGILCVLGGPTLEEHKRITQSLQVLARQIGRLVEVQEANTTLIGLRNELHLAEHGLFREKRRMQTLIDGFPTQIALLDADGNIEGTNDAWRTYGSALNGFPENCLISGANYFELYEDMARDEPLERTEVVSRLRQLRSQAITEFSTRYRIGTGKQARWVNLRAHVLRPAGYAIALEDVTDQCKADLYLQAIDVRLQNSPGHQECGDFSLDAAGNVDRWPPSAQRILGYEEVEIVGQPIASFALDYDEGRKTQTLLETVGCEDVARCFCWFIRQNGTVMCADVHVTVLCDDSTERVGFAIHLKKVSRIG